MGFFKRFEEIEAWKISKDLAIQIYQITGRNEFAKNWPLRAQMQRSAVSISSNISEGFERGTNKEFIRFLYIAKGSSGELRNQLYIARELRHIQQEDFESLMNKVLHVSSLIANLIKYLKLKSEGKK
jgi:four helix bundle protein